MLATLEVKAKCWYIDHIIYQSDFFKLHGKFWNTIPGYIWRKSIGWSVTSNLEKNTTKTCSDIVKEMPGYEGVLHPHWRKDYVKEIENVSKSECIT